MKKMIMLLLPLMLGSAYAQDNLKDEVASGIKQLITNSKDIVDGIQQGLSDSKKSSTYSDQMIIIGDSKGVEKSLTINVSKVKKLDNNRYELTVAIKNSEDKPACLTALDQVDNIMLIDNEGFASRLSDNIAFPTNRDDVVLPAKAGLRIKWVFDDVEETPATIRLYGKDFKINN